MSAYNQSEPYPPGKNQIKVCRGTVCHVKADDIGLEHFERKLAIKTGAHGRENLALTG